LAQEQVGKVTTVVQVLHRVFLAEAVVAVLVLLAQLVRTLEQALVEMDWLLLLAGLL
jgi:hypothetical protein